MAFFPIDRTSICFGELSFMNDPFFCISNGKFCASEETALLEGEHGEGAQGGNVESERRKRAL